MNPDLVEVVLGTVDHGMALRLAPVRGGRIRGRVERVRVRVGLEELHPVTGVLHPPGTRGIGQTLQGSF